MTRLQDLRIIGGHTLILDALLTDEDGNTVAAQVIPRMIISREGSKVPVSVAEGVPVTDPDVPEGAYRFINGYETTIGMEGNYVYYFDFTFDSNGTEIPIRDWFGNLNVIPGVPSDYLNS